MTISGLEKKGPFGGLLTNGQLFWDADVGLLVKAYSVLAEVSGPNLSLVFS